MVRIKVEGHAAEFIGFEGRIKNFQGANNPYCLPVLSDVRTDVPTIILAGLAVLQGRYCLKTRSRLNKNQNDSLTLHRISCKFYFCLMRIYFLSHFGHISKKM